MTVVTRPVVDLRSGPSSRSEMLTQEIFGRHLTVLGRRKDWLRCEAADGMRGWVPESALKSGVGYRPTHATSVRFATLRLGRRGGLLLPMGSLLAVKGVSKGTARVLAPDGSAARIRAGALAPLRAGRVGPARPPGLARATDLVVRLIPEIGGTPYLWGGRSTFGFDCSGLVQAVYETLGVALPRDSGDQALKGRRLKSLDRLRPLDLVFFSSRGKIDHVAIHMGDLEILHSSGHVRLESLKPGDEGFREDLRERFAWATRLIA